MSSVRLSKATKELNISLDRAVEELAKQGHEIPNNRNHKITNEQYDILMTAFADDLARKKRSEEVSAQVKEEKDLLRGTKETEEAPVQVEAPAPVEEPVATPEPVAEEEPTPAPEVETPKVEVAPVKESEAEVPVQAEPSKEEGKGPKVLGKIDLDAQKPKKKSEPNKEEAPVTK